MQASADAAVLAAVNARNSSEAERITLAQATFRSNFNPEHPDSVPAPSVTISGDQVSISTSTSVPSTFSAIYGVDQFVVDVDSSAEVSSSGKKLEVGLMVDLTGSMGSTRNGSTKIEGLKTASADLLDILLPASGANDGKVKIGVAPFADYVNAGEFAVDATGETATGDYNQLTNLKSTKNGKFTGHYSAGTIGNQSGSQSGATSATSGSWSASSGTVTSGGDTYDSGHCDNPTEIQVVVNSTDAPVMQRNSKNTGESVSRDGNNGNGNNNRWSGAAPAGMMKASEHNYYELDEYDNGWDFESSLENSGYYVPIITSAAGLTMQSRTATICNGYNHGNCAQNTTKSGPVGEAISVDDGTPPSPHALRSSSQTNGGYWDVKDINTDGTLDYQWKTSGYFLPMYNSLTSSTSTTQTVTLPQCITDAEPQGQLITCVTEREGDEAYSDEAPASGNFVGAYNHANTSKSNYSEDGKCYVAGRELPKVIPLTDDRTTLEDFFTNAKVGGATPGHSARLGLGTWCRRCGTRSSAPPPRSMRIPARPRP